MFIKMFIKKILLRRSIKRLCSQGRQENDKTRNILQEGAL
jgi:hypothetical protein